MIFRSEIHSIEIYLQKVFSMTCTYLLILNFCLPLYFTDYAWKILCFSQISYFSKTWVKSCRNQELRIKTATISVQNCYHICERIEILLILEPFFMCRCCHLYARHSTPIALPVWQANSRSHIVDSDPFVHAPRQCYHIRVFPQYTQSWPNWHYCIAYFTAANEVWGR